MSCAHQIATTRGHRPRKRSVRAGRLLAHAAMAFAVLGLITDDAAAEMRSELEVKAAFLFHFARFVEWPPDSFESDDSPIVIGILGDPEFCEVVQKVVSGKTVNDRRLEVESYTAVRDAVGSHVLFIGASHKDRLEAIAEQLHTASVFSVADAPGFARLGGVGNFLMAGNKVRFEINDDTAKEAGLKISSRLLRLAQRIE